MGAACPSVLHVRREISVDMQPAVPYGFRVDDRAPPCRGAKGVPCRPLPWKGPIVMPQLRSAPTMIPSTRRNRVISSSKPEEGSIEGEFWVVARAVALLIGGIVVLGWLLS